MKPRDKKLLMVGLAIAIVLSVMAPFLASSNPDGLESAAENFESAEGKEAGEYESPMPDYIVPALGEDAASGSIAIVAGTIVTLFLMLGLSYVLKSKKGTRMPEKRDADTS